MILPDINLLLYAHNELAPMHAAARAWWKALMEGDVAVGIAWAVAMGFVRLVTHPAVSATPITPGEALDRVEGWLERPHVHVVDPGPRHVTILRGLFAATGVAAGLTTDTHLAALALEHRAEIHSNDRDFDRFPGLRWRNPLK